MSEFFAMGGYGAYVWPSYAISVAVLAAIVAVSVRQHARATALVRRLEREEPGDAS
jgi:heme exporter protein D